jgi:hypothetical protein
LLIDEALKARLGTGCGAPKNLKNIQIYLFFGVDETAPPPAAFEAGKTAGM